MRTIPKLLSIISCVSLVSSSAFAQSKEKWDSERKDGLKYLIYCHRDDPTRCVLQLEVGERAPFAGVLQSFKQQAVLQVEADPEEIKKRIDAEVDKARREGAANLELEKKLHQIDNDASRATLAATEKNYEARIKRLEESLPKFYEQPWFVATLTFVATAGAIAGVVAISCNLKGDC